MPSTVDTAFAEFLSQSVNLDADVTKTARASRDWLLTQIGTLGSDDADFPRLYPDVNMHYGSFARRTKIRELDDIDLIIGVAADGTTYGGTPNRIELTVPDGIALRNLCHDYTNSLNSKKVINAFVRELKDVPQYNKAEIGRNGSAAVLNLRSYSWSFDIVPAFFTTREADGRQYYIIPDGNGYWKKTDPRIDQDRVSTINQAQSGNVLNALRLLKFWNARSTMPTMSSYMLETIVLDYYANGGSASSYPDIAVLSLLGHLSSAIYLVVNDPKRIQGDLNTLTWAERSTIATRASSDFATGTDARKAETEHDHQKGIRLWKNVFGPQFPSYS